MKTIIYVLYEDRGDILNEYYDERKRAVNFAIAQKKEYPARDIYVRGYRVSLPDTYEYKSAKSLVKDLDNGDVEAVEFDPNIGFFDSAEVYYWDGEREIVAEEYRDEIK